jgi:hypothetical protein
MFRLLYVYVHIEKNTFDFLWHMKRHQSYIFRIVCHATVEDKSAALSCTNSQHQELKGGHTPASKATCLSTQAALGELIIISLEMLLSYVLRVLITIEAKKSPLETGFHHSLLRFSNYYL